MYWVNYSFKYLGEKHVIQPMCIPNNASLHRYVPNYSQYKSQSVSLVFCVCCSEMAVKGSDHSVFVTSTWEMTPQHRRINTLITRTDANQAQRMFCIRSLVKLTRSSLPYSVFSFSLYKIPGLFSYHLASFVVQQEQVVILTFEPGVVSRVEEVTAVEASLMVLEGRVVSCGCCFSMCRPVLQRRTW